ELLAHLSAILVSSLFDLLLVASVVLQDKLTSLSSRFVSESLHSLLILLTFTSSDVLSFVLEDKLISPSSTFVSESDKLTSLSSTFFSESLRSCLLLSTFTSSDDSLLFSFVFRDKSRSLSFELPCDSVDELLAHLSAIVVSSLFNLLLVVSVVLQDTLTSLSSTFVSVSLHSLLVLLSFTSSDDSLFFTFLL
ncbi:hypothetical protein C0J52_07118, partial [Blattella germanica]